MELSENDLRILGSLHHVVIDLERIGDLAENIGQYTITLTDKKAVLSPEGQAELKTMSEKTLKALRTGLDVFEHRDVKRLHEVAALEQEVDDMKKTYTSNHIFEDTFVKPLDSSLLIYYAIKTGASMQMLSLQKQ
jgi:phosphate uptake regulator